MVDKNVFKMDVNLMQRFRSLKTPSESIERLLPKTFASGANFNVNPPVLPKQSAIELGPIDSISARHLHSAKPTTPVNRPNDTSAKLTSSSLSTKQISNAPKSAASVSKHPVTKASLQALVAAAAKAEPSSKSSSLPPAQSTSGGSPIKAEGLSQTPKSQTTSMTDKPTSPNTSVKTAGEPKDVMVQKEDLYCLKFNGLSVDIASDESMNDLTCPMLSETNIENAIKAIASAARLQAMEFSEENVPAKNGNNKRACVNRQFGGKQQTPRKISGDLIQVDSTTSLANSRTEDTLASPGTVKRPLPQIEHKSLTSSYSNPPDDGNGISSQESQTPANPLSLNGYLDPSNRPACFGIKKARIKITKRRNPNREREFNQPFVTQGANTECQIEHPEKCAADQSEVEKLDTTLKSRPIPTSPDLSVKEEPVDFVDLLSLPDEPEEASKENEAQTAPHSPPTKLDPASGQSSSNDLCRMGAQEGTPAFCESLNARLSIFEPNNNLQKQSVRQIACAPINHQFRRRLQQMLDISSWKKSLLSHTFFKEEPARRVGVAESRTEKISQLAGTTLTPLSESSLTNPERNLKGTSNLEVSPFRLDPILNSVVSTVKETASHSSEVIILEDDTPTPPSKLNRTRTAFVKRSLLATSPSATIQPETNNNRLSASVTPLNTQPRSAVIPVQRVAPVCVDTSVQHIDNIPVHTQAVESGHAIGLASDQEQHIQNLLPRGPPFVATPTVIKATCIPTIQTTNHCQFKRTPAIENMATFDPNPPVLAVSPPRTVHGPTAEIQEGSPVAKFVTTHLGLTSALLPSPPKLVQKAIHHSPLPNTVQNMANPSNSVNNNNGVIGMSQKRALHRLIPSQPNSYLGTAFQQAAHQSGQKSQTQHRTPNNCSVQVHVQAPVAPALQHQIGHPRHTLRLQPSQQQQQRIREEQQLVLPPSLPPQEKLYQCGYCGLTGSDMAVVAMHIATCGS
ncbi:mucin-5AC-like isoform X2 [Varroa destructor]|nr:mucin-5AC-like isoform X2 [Varroa destructor]XP_022651383.1 mucin-5AC-like isoform X2 [Varroa destructor]XP_022651392.1 mucin-5AC-like isoform X2 [Varroa destructor]